MRYIIHTADIHIGSSADRSQEYRGVFDKFVSHVLKYDTTQACIVVAGDIFHHKTRVTPEDIEDFHYLFDKLVNYTCIVIPGNHDMNGNNLDKLDLITPLIRPTWKNFHYIKQQEVRYICGVAFAHLSIYHDGSRDVEMVTSVPKEIKVVTLYHGMVDGCRFGSHVASGCRVGKKIIDASWLFLAGDIHGRQFLGGDNGVATHAAYPGSLIQQNLGEELDKGFLIWDLETRTANYVRIENPYGYLVIRDMVIPENIPENIRSVSVRGAGADKEMSTQVMAELSRRGVNVAATKIAPKRIDPINILDCMAQWLAENKSHYSQEDRDAVLQMHHDANIMQRVIKWRILSLRWDNLFRYREDNFIDFTSLNGVNGILAQNRAGKSSILDIMVYALFGVTVRGDSKSIIHNGRNEGSVSAVFESNGVKYMVLRKATKRASQCSLYEIRDDEQINISAEKIPETNKKIASLIGDLSEFLSTGMCMQGANSDITRLSRSDRKETLSKLLGLRDIEGLLSETNKKLKVTEKELAAIPVPRIPEVAGIVSPELRMNTALDIARYSVNTYQRAVDQIRTNLEEINESLAVEMRSWSSIMTASEKASALEVKKKRLAEVEATIRDLRTRFPDAKPHTITRDLKIPLDQIKTVHAQRKKELEKYANCHQCEQSKFSSAVVNTKIREVKQSLAAIEEQIKKLPIIDAERVLSIPQGSLTFNRTCPCCVENAKYVGTGQLKELINTNTESMRLVSEKLTLSEKLSQLKYLLAAAQNWENWCERKKIEDELASFNSYINNLAHTKISLAESERTAIIIEIERIEGQDPQKRVAYDELLLRSRIGNTELSKAIARLTEAKHNLAALEKEAAIFKEWCEKKPVIEQKIRRLELYISVLSNNGIKIAVISNYMRQIVNDVNKYLSLITDFSIDYVVDDTKLDFLLREGDAVLPLELASGFQQFIVGLVFRLVFTNVLMASPSFICIDEGFGCMDQENITKLPQMLAALADSYDYILLISHIPEMTAMVSPISIDVRKSHSHIRWPPVRGE